MASPDVHGDTVISGTIQTFIISIISSKYFRSLNMSYLPKNSLNAIFGNDKFAEITQEAIENALCSSLKGAPIPEKGYRLIVRLVHSISGGRNLSFALVGESELRPDHSSHFAMLGSLEEDKLPNINFDKVKNSEDLRPYFKTSSEMRVPFELLNSPNLKTNPRGNFWIYHFRFNMNDAIKNRIISKEQAVPLERGYFGVTRRPFFYRVAEHIKKVEGGGGHLFHHTWRALKDKNIPFYPIFQLSGIASTENEMYELEEEAVTNTLNPIGLNMIPGGRNGIGMLKRMGFNNANIKNRENCLAKAFNRSNSRTMHFRRPHLREIHPNQFVYVRGCWVNKFGNEIN